jgi:hypothetical protein
VILKRPRGRACVLAGFGPLLVGGCQERPGASAQRDPPPPAIERVASPTPATRQDGTGREQSYPEITPQQIVRDLAGRSVGEGWSTWVFATNEPRAVTLVDIRIGVDKATIVVRLETESKPFPLPSLPASPPPTPGPRPRMAPPPTYEVIPGMPTLPPPPTFAPLPSFSLPPIPTPSPRKWSGRLRLHYEWIVGEWNLVKIENLSFRPESLP